jgi:hypothetical protein
MNDGMGDKRPRDKLKIETLRIQNQKLGSTLRMMDLLKPGFYQGFNVCKCCSAALANIKFWVLLNYDP